MSFDSTHVQKMLKVGINNFGMPADSTPCKRLSDAWIFVGCLIACAWLIIAAIVQLPAGMNKYKSDLSVGDVVVWWLKLLSIDQKVGGIYIPPSPCCRCLHQLSWMLSQ